MSKLQPGVLTPGPTAHRSQSPEGAQFTGLITYAPSGLYTFFCLHPGSRPRAMEFRPLRGFFNILSLEEATEHSEGCEPLVRHYVVNF